MTRFNIIPALISAAITLAAIGCGDASSFDTADGLVEEGVPTTETTETTDDELELACEGFCDAVVSCRAGLVTERCVEGCLDQYGPDADDACVAAQIDLLNCYAAVDCDGSGDDPRVACELGISGLSDACGPATLRRVDDDEILEVVEIDDREWIDRDGDADDTEPTEGSDDEESEETGPVIELPDFPEFPEIPEIGPVIDFP